MVSGAMWWWWVDRLLAVDNALSSGRVEAWTGLGKRGPLSGNIGLAQSRG